MLFRSGEFADRILQMTAVAGDKPTATLLAQLDELVALIRADELRKAWLDDSRVLAALGQAYRELGDHKQAARWFQLGARRAYSQVQIGQLELLVNALAGATGDDTAAAHTAAEGIIRRLDSIAGEDSLRWPLGPDDQGRSTAASERRCLEGGLVLSRAAGLRGEAAAAELQWAARLFAMSYRQKLLRHEDAQRRTFALSNALLAAALAALAGGNEAIAIDALSFCEADDAEEIAEVPDKPTFALPADPAAWQHEAGVLLDELDTGGSGATFWHHTNRMEIVGASAVFARTLDRSASLEGLDAVMPLLRKAMILWPSPVERDSLAQRFLLIRDLAPATGRDPEFEAAIALVVAQALEAIARQPAT